MADLALISRQAIVQALKADLSLALLLPAARIYGPEPPALPEWPWAYVASPIESPVRATCLNGARLSFTIHGFAKGPGDDRASAIGNAIKRALDGRHFVLDSATADVVHEQTQIIRDSAEASAWHVICRFAVEVAA